MPIANVNPGENISPSLFGNPVVNAINGPPWIPVTYQSGWSNFGSGYQQFQYRRRGDAVEVRGASTGGVLGSPMFTLPTGFRPPATIEVPAHASVGVVGLVIASSGTVTLGTLHGVTNAYCIVSGQFWV